MKLKITYWTAGDRLTTREVEAESVEAGIEQLVDDDQAPLAQVETTEIVEG